MNIARTLSIRSVQSKAIPQRSTTSKRNGELDSAVETKLAVATEVDEVSLKDILPIVVAAKWSAASA